MLALPAGAEDIVTTKTARLGEVQADFSAQAGEFCLTVPHLKITRAGQVLLDAPPTESPQDDACKVAGLQVVNLDHQTEPEVILDFYTGGAHCCTFSLIYSFDPRSKAYTSIRHDWGNRGYRLQDLEGQGGMEFFSSDDRFAYAFAPYVSSPSPIQLWRYQPGKLVNVTRQYPKLIARDATQLWQAFEKNRQDCQPRDWGSCGEGILAAYLADKYLLEQQQQGWNQVRAAYQGNGCDFDLKCEGRESYFKQLQEFLKQQGYSR
jgi:hypothetical protein